MKTGILAVLTLLVVAIAGPVDLINNCVPVTGSYCIKSGNLTFFMTPGISDKQADTVVYWLMPFTVSIQNTGTEIATLPLSSFYIKDDSGFSVDFLKRDDAIKIASGAPLSGAGKNAAGWTSFGNSLGNVMNTSSYYQQQTLEPKQTNAAVKGWSDKAIAQLMNVPESDISIRPGERKKLLMVAGLLSENTTSFTLVYTPTGASPIEVQFSKLEPISGSKFSATKQKLGVTCAESNNYAKVLEAGNKIANAWGFKYGDIVTDVYVNDEVYPVMHRNQLEAVMRSAPTDAKLSVAVIRNNSSVALAVKPEDLPKQ